MRDCLLDGGDDGRVGRASGGDGDAGGQVDEAVAVGVDKNAAVGVDHVARQGRRHAGRQGVLAALIQRGALRAGDLLAQVTGLLDVVLKFLHDAPSRSVGNCDAHSVSHNTCITLWTRCTNFGTRTV